MVCWRSSVNTATKTESHQPLTELSEDFSVTRVWDIGTYGLVLWVSGCGFRVPGSGFRIFIATSDPKSPIRESLAETKLVLNPKP